MTDADGHFEEDLYWRREAAAACWSPPAPPPPGSTTSNGSRASDETTLSRAGLSKASHLARRDSVIQPDVQAPGSPQKHDAQVEFAHWSSLPEGARIHDFLKRHEDVVHAIHASHATHVTDSIGRDGEVIHPRPRRYTNPWEDWKRVWYAHWLSEGSNKHNMRNAWGYSSTENSRRVSIA